MLERYFVRPQTIDQIRSSWIAGAIEKYVEWLAEQGYAPRNVFHRVPVLRHFGQFARQRGATSLKQLPAHVEPFVAMWTRTHGRRGASVDARKKIASVARNAVEQMLSLVVPEFSRRRRARWATTPFEDRAPGFFAYLREERGLRDASILHYKNQLGPFEAYLDRIGLRVFMHSPRPFLAVSSRRVGTSAGRASEIDAESCESSYVTSGASNWYPET